ncbi:Wzz/FepE/Etk N-terminal domain-containing protein [Tunturiibacter empetritectus]|uniref:Polysaccharide chain length determinant protein (PEP-CTERM system associated) n=2 Tax=Tunturiibacter TaxID=3154218 RepID=A0A852VII6_9BACT|nr:Wzz/FepE/Etk N-terminal domain-containing protein [Edaphobacter lichenicola]NYF90939.1 polysaccharide chain length determinant protein (PEP-CTERM system associated) [Edaphobacter lichenicola]
MLGHRALTVQDYLTILKRRWWILAIPAIIFPIVGFALTFLVQAQYISQTLVLVEQQKVPESYVKAVVTEDLSGRLASMKEQILSRSRLQPIIERFNLFANGKLSMDERIDLTRKNIGITPIQSEIARTNGLPGFFISFKANDARTAQLVCGEIQSLFVSENLSDRAASAAGTTEFLKSQLADAKAKLDEQDARLAKFQQTYMGKLPGAETSNMNMLTTLNTQLDAATQALARMEQDKSYTESMLSLQQAQQSQSTERGAPAPQTQLLELQQLEAQESELTARYTDDYPDVVTVRRKIKELEQKMAQAPAASAAPLSSAPKPTDSLSVQQMRAQLRAMEQGIAQKKRDQAAVQAELRTYQDRVASSPAVEEEYKSITRDTSTAQAFYDDLLNKLNQSKMATDLERRQQGEQFRVMDEPNLPEEPAFPKRSVFALGGFAVGLGLGLFIIALLEYLDTAVRNERDIWAFTKLPTLGVIGFAGEGEPVVTKRSLFGRRSPDVTSGSKPLMNAGG